MKQRMKTMLIVATALMMALICHGAALAEGTAWSALQARFDNAAGSETIVLDGDVKALANEANLYIRRGKSITIDLHGHSIDRARTAKEENGHVFLVEGSLTVIDSVGGGTITGGKNKNRQCGTVIVNGGTFTMASGTICNNFSYYGGGVYIAKGTFNMIGGAITGNVATCGSAVYNKDGNFNMSGGTISGNKAINGGVESKLTGDFTMEKLLEELNSVNGGGAAVEGTMNVYGSPVIKDNMAGSRPFNVNLDPGRVVYINGGLADDALICVTRTNEGVITKGIAGAGKASSFRMDLDDIYLRIDGSGELKAAREYTVTFDTGFGASKVEPQKVFGGDRATEPKPTKDDDKLLGWQTEDGADFSFNTPITGNTTLKAVWEHPPVFPVNGAGKKAYDIVKYELVKSDTVNWDKNDWYVVKDDTTIGSTVNVTGNVDLVLRNGKKLTASGGIFVHSGAKLTIWAESTKDKVMGRLAARGGRYAAGIGGSKNASHGEIVINGGVIEAFGGAEGAGIGGGQNRGLYKVTINGGDVTAIGGDYGAGIGGGNDGTGGVVSIKGGDIKAYGGLDAAGIGGGAGKSANDVTIDGGTVYAKGGKGGGAGIGSASGEDFNGNVTINGGNVRASGDLEYSTGPNYGGAGIGAGYAGNAIDGHVTINGGSVEAFNAANKGAGIGGGNENFWGTGGEGTNVVINGGRVIAWTWTGSEFPVPDSFEPASAIGHGGTDKVNGSLFIKTGMKVSAGNDVYNFVKTYTVQQRESACHDRMWALIEPCDHPDATYSVITPKTHLRDTCIYCNQVFMGEEHVWDEKTKTCKLCGYAYTGEQITISFDANGGSGEMEPITFVPGGKYAPPECGFTPPEGGKFQGWMVYAEGSTSKKWLNDLQVPKKPFRLPMRAVPLNPYKPSVVHGVFCPNSGKDIPARN